MRSSQRIGKPEREIWKPITARVAGRVPHLCPVYCLPRQGGLDLQRPGGNSRGVRIISTMTKTWIAFVAMLLAAGSAGAASPDPPVELRLNASVFHPLETIPTASQPTAAGTGIRTATS